MFTSKNIFGHATPIYVYLFINHIHVQFYLYIVCIINTRKGILKDEMRNVIIHVLKIVILCIDGTHNFCNIYIHSNKIIYITYIIYYIYTLVIYTVIYNN